MRVSQLLHEAQAELEQLGVESAAVDVQLLLGHCLGKTRTELFLAASEKINLDLTQKFSNLFERRKKREPLAYILGEQEFWSLDFHVNSDVLIPRPETEFMLERVLANQGEWRQGGNIVDLCTGSGVIAVVLAKELGRKVTAIDISEKALAVTARNINRHKLDNLISCLISDLFCDYNKSDKISLLVSNPPYVRKLAIANEVEPEVRDYEPHLALDGGGDDGLTLIRKMWDELQYYLADKAEIFIEFGAEQGQAVKEVFSNSYSNGNYYTNIEIIKDYSGRDRVVNATFNYA